MAWTHGRRSTDNTPAIFVVCTRLRRENVSLARLPFHSTRDSRINHGEEDGAARPVRRTPHRAAALSREEVVKSRYGGAGEALVKGRQLICPRRAGYETFRRAAFCERFSRARNRIRLRRFVCPFPFSAFSPLSNPLHSRTKHVSILLRT